MWGEGAEQLQEHRVPCAPASCPLLPPRFHSPKGPQESLGRKARSFSPPCLRCRAQRSTLAVGFAKTLPRDSATSVSSEIGGSRGIARWKCQGRWGLGERLLRGQRHPSASESESDTPLMGAGGSGRSRSGQKPGFPPSDPTCTPARICLFQNPKERVVPPGTWGSGRVSGQGHQCPDPVQQPLRLAPAWEEGNPGVGADARHDPQSPGKGLLSPLSPSTHSIRRLGTPPRVRSW